MIAHIRWTARWLPGHQVRVAVAHDITERKFTESMHEVMYAVSEAAHTTQNLQALFQHIHEVIGRLLPASNFTVALCDADSGALSFPYHVSDQGPYPRCPAQRARRAVRRSDPQRHHPVSDAPRTRGA